MAPNWTSSGSLGAMTVWDEAGPGHLAADAAPPTRLGRWSLVPAMKRPLLSS